MSNRQHRRARQRDRASSHDVRSGGDPMLPKGTIVHAQALTPTGEQHEVTNVRAMPPKRAGHHRWQALLAFALSEEQAEALTDGGGKVLFDSSSVVMMPMAYCIDCEGLFQEVRAEPCPAGDEWRNPGA